MNVFGCGGITVMQDFNVNVQPTVDFALVFVMNKY